MGDLTAYAATSLAAANPIARATDLLARVVARQILARSAKLDAKQTKLAPRAQRRRPPRCQGDRCRGRARAPPGIATSRSTLPPGRPLAPRLHRPTAAPKPSDALREQSRVERPSERRSSAWPLPTIAKVLYNDSCKNPTLLFN